jgi:hypothetical protein
MEHSLELQLTVETEVSEKTCPSGISSVSNQYKANMMSPGIEPETAQWGAGHSDIYTCIL